MNNSTFHYNYGFWPAIDGFINRLLLYFQLGEQKEGMEIVWGAIFRTRLSYSLYSTFPEREREKDNFPLKCTKEIAPDFDFRRKIFPCHWGLCIFRPTQHEYKIVLLSASGMTLKVKVVLETGAEPLEIERK